MRTSILFVALLMASGFLFAADNEIRNPIITIRGEYSGNDGRVMGHMFPVEIVLSGDGSVAGVYESWMEERASDGSTHLNFGNISFKGTWMMKENTIRITPDTDTLLPTIAFPDLQGLKIRIMRKEL